MLLKAVLPNQEETEKGAQESDDKLEAFAQDTESFRRKGKGQTDQAAHHEHAADRAKAEHRDINEPGD